MVLTIGPVTKPIELCMKAIAVLALLGVLAGCGRTQTSPPTVEGVDAEQSTDSALSVTDAEAIFDYAYPLVIMKVSQDLMLTAPNRPRTPPNHFIHFRRLAQPEQRAVVLGNRNTLYSVGWLDLSKGPVVFKIPDMGDRYYVMPLLDAWTNTFESLGSRTTGQRAQHYLIASADFEGDVPDGYALIRSPTDMVWITGRIQADSAEDAKRVAALQDDFVLTTLQEHETGIDPFQDFEPTFTFAKVRLPIPYSLKMAADEFYDTFFDMWVKNKGPSTDEAMVELMQRFGIVFGQTDRFADLSEDARSLLEAGLKTKQARYAKAFYDGTAQTEPWIFNLDPAMGNWGADYTRRAYWAMWGLGTNIAKDAVYGVTQLDSHLAPLNGSNTYRLHFDADDLPPTYAFWSVTNYDAEGYLERNALDRYSLGSNHQLTFNADGTLDIYLSHTKPDLEGVNWVPAPEGDFKTLLRIYWPREDVLAGDWSLPDVEKIEEQSNDDG